MRKDPLESFSNRQVRASNAGKCDGPLRSHSPSESFHNDAEFFKSGERNARRASHYQRDFYKNAQVEAAKDPIKAFAVGSTKDKISLFSCRDGDAPKH